MMHQSRKELQRLVHLKSLFLRDFRNFTECEVHFSKGLNVIFGDNAQGKTNLLEAIHLISTGRSFRTQSLPQLIKDKSSGFYLEASIVRDEVNQSIQLSFDGQVKRLKIDGNEYSSFHPLLGLLPLVLYTPYDIELIAGPPSERRRFLNLHLAQSDPLYVHHLTCFWRAMKQRNCLLKAKKEASIEIWENQMGLSANYIVAKRLEMLEQLKTPLLDHSKRLSHEQEVFSLELLVSMQKDYEKQLQRMRKKEMDYGVTLNGPHRDDLNFLINHKSARHFGSEGQKKTMIAALRLAEWQRLSARIDQQALIGFDDLSQNLDDLRLNLLKNELKNLGQVFVTTPQKPTIEGDHIEIQKGAIRAQILQ